jgi:hypothetical protein
MEIKNKTPIDSKVMKYKEEAYNFCLEAIYTENKVFLTLNDYTDWTIYEKTYTK